MWIIVASLLVVPLAAAVVILGRVLGGSPALTDKERRLFGQSEDATLSFWIWFKLAVLVALFFVWGFLEGVVLINLGPVWMVLAPLVTGIGAMLILLLWLQGAGQVTSYVARLYRAPGDSEQEVHETRYRKKTIKRRTKRHAAHTGKASSAGFGG